MHIFNKTVCIHVSYGCVRVCIAYIFMLSQLTVRGINFVILPTSTQLA